MSFLCDVNIHFTFFWKKTQYFNQRQIAAMQLFVDNLLYVVLENEK